MPITIFNEKNFEEEVLKNKEPVLVCFSSPNCPSCSKIIPILEEVSKEGKVGIINIYESSEITKEYNIPAVPALIIFKNGKVKDKAIGIRSKEILISKLI